MSDLNRDSISLLRECSAGCKMAIETFDEIRSKVKDKQIRELIDKYYDQHVKLRVECSDTLMDAGAKDKDLSLMTKTMAAISTNVKMMINDDKSEAAKILTDGCNLGVKQLSEYINVYKCANSKATEIAEKLRRLEEEMAGDLQSLL